MNADYSELASLCASAVAAYIDVCGTTTEPSLDGLIMTEAANWHTWRADGFGWLTVKVGLSAAWTARAEADVEAAEAE